ncbi:tetrathionate reductase subunit B precursor [mine drainage metagenome]|uniref:Tetrathionate reductase subunit B n=1 Tax=mine drainage metagenome TaxID=410659 RepID=A0A1J5SLY5_9ZZZZ
MTQLALVIDLDVCVGCHACVTSCKQWNTSSAAGPLSDHDPYGPETSGVFFNRVQTFEVGQYPDTQVVHFPKSCLHCEEPPCVPVCPTGASYKRKEDGIVLVDADKCIGCKYCAWACPYGAREFDEQRGIMTKCTLCVDRIYDESTPPERRNPACVNACPTHARLFGDVHDPDSDISRAIRERGGYALMPELGTRPANQYLPRRAMVAAGMQSGSAQSTPARVTRGNPAHDGGESAAAAELVRESETILARLFGGLRGKARKRAQPAAGALQMPKAAQSCACGAGQGGCASAKPAGPGLGGQLPAAAGLPVSRLFAEG